MSQRRLVSLLVTIALPAIAAAQTIALRSPRAVFESMTKPPVPADPLELVMTDAQTVATPEQRQAVTALLDKARAHSNVRAHPYHLKTNFTSYGSSSSDGAWSLEDTSPARKVYRWTAQGPNYSVIDLYNDNLLYSNQPAGTIPLRLTQVREAIFFIYPNFGPYASLRTATGFLNGVTLECVLGVQGAVGRTFSGGRDWEESEYCVDPQQNLLITYSPAPGLYVHYDYTNAINFHGTVVPGAFMITEAGRPVIDAKTESVIDPSGLNPALFAPSGLSSIGVGSVMTQPERVRSLSGMGSAPANGNANIDVVEVIAVSSPEGQLSEPEVLASSNTSLNQTALERAQNWHNGRQTQSGATPQSHEVIFTFQFVTPQS
ncbi:MAG TPA: hypothetical protein VLY24_12855 [Bryobacteraceae bacterium]|nr:hypothetical protein [Bryobacteraceae bacterium]